MNDNAGNLLFGITSPASLEDLVTILLLSSEKGGLEAQDALNLHGSKNAALRVYSAGQGIYSRGNLTAVQANVLIARHRKD